MTRQTIPTTDPDATEAPPLRAVLIRYPNLSGALVTVRVADHPRGTANISPSPTLNRYAECSGCGDTRASVERGVRLDEARTWANKHAAECRALPQPEYDVTVRFTDGRTELHEGVSNERARELKLTLGKDPTIASIDVDPAA